MGALTVPFFRGCGEGLTVPFFRVWGVLTVPLFRGYWGGLTIPFFCTHPNPSPPPQLPQIYDGFRGALIEPCPSSAGLGGLTVSFLRGFRGGLSVPFVRPISTIKTYWGSQVGVFQPG